MNATVRITCNCKTCKANATTMGKSAPLAAMVPEALLTMVKGKTHGLVNMAHDPNAVTGEAARVRTGVKAV
jgi:hypothetical protein